MILSLCSSTPSHCCLLISNGYISASILQFWNTIKKKNDTILELKKKLRLFKTLSLSDSIFKLDSSASGDQRMAYIHNDDVIVIGDNKVHSQASKM